jgi:CBS domain-containing protein
MKVEAILRGKGRTVETIPPEMTVEEAVSELAARRIGALVVSSDGERVEGLISEREVVRGLAGYGAGLLSMTVEQVMSHHVPHCSPQDTVEHLMQEMTVTRRRHFPVVDDGRLCGIVSIGDLVKNRLEELEYEVVALRGYITHG